MKIITNLPDWEKQFKQIPHQTKWSYVWEHKSTSKLRICANSLHPWGSSCVIRFKYQKFKGENIAHVTRLDLEIFPSSNTENAVPASLLLEQWSGIPYSDRPTLRFYAIKREDAPMNVMLSVVPVEIQKLFRE